MPAKDRPIVGLTPSKSKIFLPSAPGMGGMDKVEDQNRWALEAVEVALASTRDLVRKGRRPINHHQWGRHVAAQRMGLVALAELRQWIDEAITEVDIRLQQHKEES